MGWETSDRKQRLPRDWVALRLRVLRRDHYSCQARDEAGLKCLAPASDVDHIERGDNHAMTNLQALCHSCHATKTAREGNAAWAARRIPIRRPPETHPADL